MSNAQTWHTFLKALIVPHKYIFCVALQHKACWQYWPRARGGSPQRRPLLLHSTGEQPVFFYMYFQWHLWTSVCDLFFYLSLQMWACALGHTEAALVLYQWDPRALAIPDSLGRLPLNIARSRGHTRLAELLEQLQQSPQAQGQPADTWMDRWRGESQTSGISNNPTSNSGGKAHCFVVYHTWETFSSKSFVMLVYTQKQYPCIVLVVCSQVGSL